jgi:hypothetical protein
VTGSKWGRGEEGGEWELWGESVIGFMCGWALVDGLLHFLAFNLQKQENGLLHLGFGLWSMIWMNGLLHFLAIFLHFLAPVKDFHIVAIHPDHNSFILVQHWNQKLVSYNMDTQELHGLCTLENGYVVITLTYSVSWSHRFLPPNTEVVVSGGLLCMFNKSLIIQVLGKLAVWVNLLELGGAKLDYMSLGDLV